MTCRFVASDQPRMMRTHLRDCNASGCQGCEPCPERHCGICGREHVTLEQRGTDQTCASCIGDVRSDLAQIEVDAAVMLAEAMHRGVNSEAANLAGPAPDTCEGIEAYRHRAMSAFWGRIVIEEGDDQHPLWVLGTWEMLVREHLAQPSEEQITITGARKYLDGHLSRLAHDPGFAFEELARDVRRCRGHLEDVRHDSRRAQQGAPCPMCGRARLELRHADCDHDEGCPLDEDGVSVCADLDRWTCPRCAAAYTEHDYRTKVNAVYVMHAEALPASEITKAYRVPEGTLRRWASEVDADGKPRVRKRGRDQYGRLMYDVADVKRARDRRAAS